MKFVMTYSGGKDCVLSLDCMLRLYIRPITKNNNMTTNEFIEKLINIVQNYKTIYVLGCFGSPMTKNNKKHFIENQKFNSNPEQRKIIDSTDDNTFGFDCSGLIKGILWGWSGNNNLIHGGAIYLSNNIPDLNSNQLINVCKDVNEDFSQITAGEVVWIKNHIGVYIGNNLVVESTPICKNGVQITACNCSKYNYYSRTWSKHGKLPYITYKNL